MTPSQEETFLDKEMLVLDQEALIIAKFIKRINPDIQLVEIFSIIRSLGKVENISDIDAIRELTNRLLMTSKLIYADDVVNCSTTLKNKIKKKIEEEEQREKVYQEMAMSIKRAGHTGRILRRDVVYFLDLLKYNRVHVLSSEQNKLKDQLNEIFNLDIRRRGWIFKYWTCNNQLAARNLRLDLEIMLDNEIETFIQTGSRAKATLSRLIKRHVK
jgi:hypothetical protein